MSMISKNRKPDWLQIGGTCLAILAALAAVLISPKKSGPPEMPTIVREEYSGPTYGFLTAADDQYLYVYYDEKGIVNVYRQGGPFLFRIELDHIPNGKGAIAARDGLLYVKARGNVIYVLRGETLIDWAAFSAAEGHDNTSYERYAALMNG